nr:U6 snRNA-associated Sm-like protein LSm4 [Euglena gracilis]|eukprot:EG_transcript_43397
MLPLSLLKAAVGHPILVELKNAETMNGHLFNCDSWMNMNLRDVICTSRDGDRFWKIRECYIRGNTIKSLRVPDEIIEKVKEESSKQRQQSGKPGRGGRGRGNLGRSGEGKGKGKGKGKGDKADKEPKSAKK